MNTSSKVFYNKPVNDDFSTVLILPDDALSRIEIGYQTKDKIVSKEPTIFRADLVDLLASTNVLAELLKANSSKDSPFSLDFMVPATYSIISQRGHLNGNEQQKFNTLTKLIPHEELKKLIEDSKNLPLQTIEDTVQTIQESGSEVFYDKQKLESYIQSKGFASEIIKAFHTQ